MTLQKRNKVILAICAAKATPMLLFATLTFLLIPCGLSVPFGATHCPSF